MVSLYLEPRNGHKALRAPRAGLCKELDWKNSGSFLVVPRCPSDTGRDTPPSIRYEAKETLGAPA